MRAVLASLAAALLLSSPADAGQKRSYAAKAEFKRAQHCPSTGRPRGPCPGYEIDHRVPLKCGGADAPGNMQWLTVEDHRRKTAREASACRK